MQVVFLPEDLSRRARGRHAMKIRQEDSNTVLILDAEETRLLRVALERAMFEDTRPEDQEAAYRLADVLSSTLARLQAPAD